MVGVGVLLAMLFNLMRSVVFFVNKVTGNLWQWGGRWLCSTNRKGSEAGRRVLGFAGFMVSVLRNSMLTQQLLVYAILGFALSEDSVGLTTLCLEGTPLHPLYLVGALGASGGEERNQGLLNVTECFPRLTRYGLVLGTTRKFLAGRARLLYGWDLQSTDRHNIWESFAGYDVTVPVNGTPTKYELRIPDSGFLQIHFNWLAAHTAAVRFSRGYIGGGYRQVILCYCYARKTYYLEFYGSGVSYPQPNTILVPELRQPLVGFEEWLLAKETPLWSSLEIVGFGTLFEAPFIPANARS
jgi:hypothetical protein